MNIVAVLVTYRPDLPVLETLLKVLAPQVAGIVLVDNGSGAAAQTGIRNLVDGQGRAVLWTDNRGLAAAQNAGIADARAMGAAAVLLMDQDSLPAPDMVAALRAAFVKRRAHRPAAIGPGYAEPHRSADAGLPGGQDVPEMPALIASGSLIPLPVFDAVGPFDEGLFIDFVDTDWCFRARSLGYRCFAARAAQMTHRIGEGTLRIAGRTRTVHSPVRMYYQTRNLILMARRPTTPRGWALRMIPRTLARGLILSLVKPPRLRRLQAVTRGLRHGLQGRSGPGFLP